MAGFGAVLDACVLVPIALSDTLLRLAERDLYWPIWSVRILAETRAAIVKVHPDLNSSRVDARLHAMNSAFDDACVVGWESLVDGLSLPDEDDRHVLAVAIRGRAELIVTANLADFPIDRLQPYGLQALSPDDFLLNQLDLDPAATLAVIREQAADQRDPRRTVQEVLEALRRANAPQFAAACAAILAAPASP